MRARQHIHAGFTLLEVMVAMAILAIALVSLMESQTSCAVMTNYVRNTTLATLLARQKMIEIEDIIRLPNREWGKLDEDEGDFGKDGYPDFRWKAEVKKMDMCIDINNLLSGLMGGTPSGPDGGGLGIAPKNTDSTGGFIQSQVDRVLKDIQQNSRYVKLTILWMEGAHERSFDLVTHVVNLPDAPSPGQTLPQPPQTPNPGGGNPPQQNPNQNPNQYCPPGLDPKFAHLFPGCQNRSP
ncbi:MAG: hypothetical protein GMKNLPBB_00613 [Myxococcota bacterium]|nr:hypothetical protein [Myxococcota bacterium]